MANSIIDQERRAKDITEQCSALYQAIDTNREVLVEELLKYESWETASDEIWRSLDCLKNITKELKYLSYGKVSLMCTFFPVNLPLYSLVLFAMVPGFMADEIIVRPPNLMSEIVQKIYNLLHLSKLMPQIKFVNLERKLFVEAYISIAEVILFTGRYENAKIVQEACPDALFIYNGAGINPVLITDSANLDIAVKKTIEMRTFNSGQDCAGSDAILVHEKIAKAFVDKLVMELQEIRVGNYNDPEVKVGKLVKIDQIGAIKNFFADHANSLVFGGKIDSEAGIVYPTVIVDDIHHIKKITYTEFFAPVFYLLIYHDDRDLKRYFSSGYEEYAMYVSMFGKITNISLIPNSIVLPNQIVNDMERGNNPYGGYGPKANFASYNGIYHYRPILISQEICSFLQRQHSKSQQIQAITYHSCNCSS